MINIRKIVEFVENLGRVVDSLKRILYFSKDIVDYRSRIIKPFFIGTQNNPLCGLREIFITNVNISVKMIISKYDNYLHRKVGCI